MNDQTLLHILNHDPQRGMTLLVEQYTGLVWKVISLHLRNPENIKECTNDTFAEFYFHRDHFDPERSSLAVWLAAIARNLAISRFRKERKLQAEPLPFFRLRFSLTRRTRLPWQKSRQIWSARWMHCVRTSFRSYGCATTMV